MGFLHRFYHMNSWWWVLDMDDMVRWWWWPSILRPISCCPPRRPLWSIRCLRMFLVMFIRSLPNLAWSKWTIKNMTLTSKYQSILKKVSHIMSSYCATKQGDFVKLHWFFSDDVRMIKTVEKPFQCHAAWQSPSHGGPSWWSQTMSGELSLTKYSQNKQKGRISIPTIPKEYQQYPQEKQISKFRPPLFLTPRSASQTPTVTWSQDISNMVTSKLMFNMESCSRISPVKILQFWQEKTTDLYVKSNESKKHCKPMIQIFYEIHLLNTHAIR